jgi:hypothetical protein
MPLSLNSIVGRQDMGASPIVKQVYREHVEHFGEPDDSIVYEDDEAPYGRPVRIDIFVSGRVSDRAHLGPDRPLDQNRH